MKCYYAVFNETEDSIEVIFPDLEGCVTFGSDFDEAVIMAFDALNVWLENTEGQFINPPSTYKELVKRFQKEKIVPIPISGEELSKNAAFIPMIMKFLNGRIKEKLDDGESVEEFNYLIKVREHLLKEYKSLGCDLSPIKTLGNKKEKLR